MSMKNRIQEAQLKAATEVVRQGLENHRGNLVRLNEILQSVSHLEVILTSQGSERLLVLPAHSQNPSNLETELFASLNSALKDYEPEAREVGKYSVLKLKTQKKVPKSLEIYANGVRFELDIVEQDLDFDMFRQDIQNRTRKKRETKRESLPESEWYTPNIETGFEFEIDKSRNNPKYPLLPLNKQVRDYFPGLRIPFYLVYSGEETQTHITCASSQKKIGELAGNYISAGMTNLFRTHPEIRNARVLQMKAVEPGKIYEIAGIRK
jgi:hypothetical protein